MAAAMAKPNEPARRGRPPRASSHPLGRHLRGRRELKGYTIRELATRVGLGPSAAGYISQLGADPNAIVEFQNEFMESMYIPHMTDPFPHLQGIVRDEILNQ